MRFAIIIGAQRAGTTSLFQYLRQHPEISGCAAGKQTDFFTFHWDRDFDWYRSLWEWNPDQYEWALEASPSYTMLPHRPNAAKRIANVDADFRFVYLIRNPIDRIRSHYHHGLYCGEIDRGLSFTQALRTHPILVDYTRYATQVRQYDQEFGREKTLIITTESLNERTNVTLKTICTFLGLDDDFKFKGVDKKYNTRASKGREPTIYRSIKRIKTARLLARQLIPLYWRDQIRTIFLNEEPDINYPEVKPEVSTFIYEKLKDEVRQLEKDERVCITDWEI